MSGVGCIEPEEFVLSARKFAADEVKQGDGACPVFRVIIRLREKFVFRDARVSLSGGRVGKLTESDAEDGSEAEKFAGKFMGTVPCVKEDAGEGAVSFPFAQDVQQLALCAYAVEVDESLMPKGCTEVDV